MDLRLLETKARNLLQHIDNISCFKVLATSAALRYYRLMFYPRILSSLLHVTLLLALLSPLLPDAFCAAANGIGRGGGDVYVAEFRDLSRLVLQNIETWRKDGTLVLTDQEVAQLRETSEKALVLSEERVCLDTITCKENSQEVDAVNEPDKNPPQITLGRIRWDALKDRPLDRELLVLHELLSVSKINDRTFADSYELKAKGLRDWQQFKTQMKTTMDKLYSMNLDMFTMDFTHLDTYIKIARRTPQYRDCQDHAGTSRRAKKFQEEFCLPLVSLLLESKEDMNINAQLHYDELKKSQNDLIKDLNDWIHTQHPTWANWAVDLVNQYLKTYTTELKKAQSAISSEQVVSMLEQQCPSRNDFSFTLACSYDTLETYFPAHCKQAMDASKDELSRAFSAVTMTFSSRLDPL